MHQPQGISRLWRCAPGSGSKLLIAVAFAAAAGLLAPAAMLATWAVLRLFIMNTATLPSVALPCCAALLAAACGGILRILSTMYAHKAAFMITTGTRGAVMTHLGRVALHWFSSQSTGALKKTLTHDLQKVENFIAHNITDCVAGLLLPIVSVLCLLFVDARMALALSGLIAAAVLLQMRSLKKMRTSNLFAKYYESLGMMHADAVEFVQGMPVIKIFNRTAESFDRMQKAIGGLKEIQQESQTYYAGKWASFMTVAGMPLSVLGVVGAFLYSRGSLALEDLVLCLLLGSVSLAPLVSLSRFAAFLLQGLLGWGNIRALLELPVAQRGERTRRDMGVPDVEVKDLHVAYGGKEVLHGIGFTARAGTITAIVGPSGSGKSTLAAVIAGMEKAESGSVTAGGYNLEEYSETELPGVLSIVFQSPFIFTGTVAENIRLGCEDASLEDVERAAGMAQCGEMIAGFPKGYDTLIGQGGEVRLSGGQLQRIALARMVLRNAPIVLLDEATAFADPESESAIQQGLACFLAEKTVLVIAHRLPSIAGADSIIVLDQGRVAEQGTHAELIGLNGLYARMWEAHHTARAWAIQTGAEPEVAA